MGYIKKLCKYIVDKEYRFLILSNLGFFDSMNDEEYLKRKYKAILKKELNLENPVTYNEKIQWMKLNDRKKMYTTLVDKYETRKYVKKKIGEEYLIPLLGVWDNPDDIDFEKLPNRFVLKCNHNSGLGMCICKNKSSLNIKKARRKLKKGMKENYYLKSREWPYKNVKRKIIAEKYIGNEDNVPDDYKFLVINGNIDNILVCKDREKGKPKFFYFDEHWNRLYCQKNEPIDIYGIEKPDKLNKMIEIVNELSKGFKTVRIDLYNLEGKIYFGEVTFYDQAGFETDITEQEDFRRGEKLIL